MKNELTSTAAHGIPIIIYTQYTLYTNAHATDFYIKACMYMRERVLYTRPDPSARDDLVDALNTVVLTFQPYRENKWRPVLENPIEKGDSTLWHIVGGAAYIYIYDYKICVTQRLHL